MWLEVTPMPIKSSHVVVVYLLTVYCSTLVLTEPSRYDQQVRRSKRDIVVDAKFVGDALYEPDAKRGDIPAASGSAVTSDKSDTADDTQDVRSTIPKTEKSKGSLLGKTLKATESSKVQESGKTKESTTEEAVQSRTNVNEGKKEADSDRLTKDSGDEGAQVVGAQAAAPESPTEQDIVPGADDATAKPTTDYDGQVDSLQTGDNIRAAQSSDFDGIQNNDNAAPEMAKRSKIATAKATNSTKRNIPGTIKQIFEKLYDNHHPGHDNHKQTHTTSFVDQRPGLMKKKRSKLHGARKHKTDKKSVTGRLNNSTLHKQSEEQEQASKRFCMDYHDSCCHDMCPPQHMHHVHHHHRHIHHEDHQIVLHRPGVIYHPAPTVVHRPDIIIHRPPLLVHRPVIVVHQPPVILHRPPVYYKQPDVIFHTPHSIVREPTIYSHDMYQHVPHLQQVDSHIENHELTTHIGDQCNSEGGMDSHAYNMCGQSVKGTSYQEKGAGDYYNTQNYGDMNDGDESAGNAGSSSGSSSSSSSSRSSIADTKTHNKVRKSSSGKTADAVKRVTIPTTAEEKKNSAAEEDQNRKRRSTSHEESSKHRHASKRSKTSKKHRIVVNRPDIIYHQSPEIVHRPPIIVHRPDVVVHRPSIMVRRPAVVVHRPAIAYHQPPVIFSTPNPIIERPTAVSHDLFVQHSVPQHISSRVEHAGAEITDPRVVGVGHNVVGAAEYGPAQTLDGGVVTGPHHGTLVAANNAGDLVHDEAGNVIQEQVHDVGPAVEPAAVEADHATDIVQGPLTHSQHQQVVDANDPRGEYLDARVHGGEYAPIANEQRVGVRTGEPTGEVTQEYDQQSIEAKDDAPQVEAKDDGPQIEAKDDGAPIEGKMDGFNGPYEGAEREFAAPRGPLHRGVAVNREEEVDGQDARHYGRGDYEQQENEHVSSAHYQGEVGHQEAGFDANTRRYLGMENPSRGEEKAWAKSSVPSHKHKHKRSHKHKNHKQKSKHAQGVKRNGGIDAGSYAPAGAECGGGPCTSTVPQPLGTQNFGGCGVLHGGPPCGDATGVPAAAPTTVGAGDGLGAPDLGGLNTAGQLGVGATVGTGAIPPVGDHNAGCIEDCAPGDNHQCCGTQSTVLYRPDVVFHPRPELYHRPDIIVHRPDVVIHRPSVVIHQPPVLVHRPAVVVHQPPIIFHQPAPEIRRPQLVSHDQYVTHPVPEKVGSEIHHTGNIIAHGGYYDGAVAGIPMAATGSALAGPGIDGAGLAGGFPNGGVVGGGIAAPGATGGCLNGVCGVDQHTEVGAIPHGLDNSQEAVHFGNALTGAPSGCQEGAPGCAAAGLAGQMGNAFGKSKVETPKKEAKEEQADKKDKTKQGETKVEEKKAEKKEEIKKDKKDEAKVVKRDISEIVNRFRKSVSEKKAKKSKSESASKKSCFEGHHSNCHTFPGHATVIHRPDVVFHQRPEVIHRPDIVVHRPDVVIHRPDVVIHRPALVVHKPPMVIKQSPIVFHQQHPIVQQPVEQAHDMYVTHNVPQRVGSNVVSAGVHVSNGCHGPNCGAPVAYLNQADNYAPVVAQGTTLAAGHGALAGYGAVNAAGYGAVGNGYTTDGAVDGGCQCAENEQDCGCGTKKTKISKKHVKGSKKHKIEVTGSKRYFGGSGHEGGYEGHGFAAHDEAGYGREGGFHGHEHGHHYAADLHHGHGDHGDWDHGHGHTSHGDIHHADEQNIIVQRPDIVFHPRPELYHRPDIVVHRPDIVIHRPSVVIHQPPVLVHRPAVIYHQPPVVFHQPGPVVHRPRVVSHDMYVQRAQKEQVGSQIEHAGGDFVGHGGYYEGHEHDGHAGHPDAGYEGGDHGEERAAEEEAEHNYHAGDHAEGGEEAAADGDGNFHGFSDGHHGGGNHGGVEHDVVDHDVEHEGGGPSYHGFHFGDHGFGHHGDHEHAGGPSFHGFHFGDHGFGRHGGPHNHDSSFKRSKISHSKKHHKSSASKKHNVVVYRPPIIYHPPSEVYHRAPLIVHRPDVVIHRPAVVIHRPPVVVHRPDIIYHQSPVVFDTPPPKLHTEVVKQHDNFVMRPVLQHVGSHLRKNPIVHTNLPGPHHLGPTVESNEGAAPIHVMAHEGHAGTTVLSDHVANGPIAPADGEVVTPEGPDVAGNEPWPVEAGGVVDGGAPGTVVAGDHTGVVAGAHAKILDGSNDGVVGAQSTLLDAGRGVVTDDDGGAVLDDGQGAVVNGAHTAVLNGAHGAVLTNGHLGVVNTHGAVLNGAAHGAILDGTTTGPVVNAAHNTVLSNGVALNGAHVVDGHRTVLTTHPATAAGAPVDDMQQDDGAYMPDEEPAKAEIVDHSRPAAPVLNGQHIQVVVDGRRAPAAQQGVAINGVDNSHELTNAAVGNVDEAAESAAEAAPIEAKEDEEPAEAKTDDAQVAVGDAAAAAQPVEPEDAEHDGDRAAAPETAADNHQFSTEAKDDGNITSVEAKEDEIEEETPRAAAVRPAKTVRASQAVAARAPPAAAAEEGMIQDNSLLESHEPEADGTAPAPEAVTATREPAGDAEGEAEARDRTATPAEEKNESGSGKSTVAKSAELKKDAKKEKKEKKKSKVAKKKSDEVAKTRKKRDSLLSKFSIVKRSATTTKEEPTKKEKIAKNKKTKKRSRTPNKVTADAYDGNNKKRRKSKKNDIVVKRPPVIYHPPPEIYHRPPIIVHRPPLVIRRPPIIYHQPPVIVHRPAVVYHQPPLVFHQPPPAVSQPILKSHDTFMMHPAAHLTHMGSMVTNAGTYVGVPEHRFMYQSGMGFLHAPGGGNGPEGGDHGNAGGPAMQYPPGAEEHHEAENERAMPQEMESGAGGPSPEGDFHGGEERAMNGGTQQIVDQAMNENDQGMNAPGGGESEMVEQQNGPQQGMENSNGGFSNEAAYGRNEVPGESGGMLKKDNTAGNPAEQNFKSQNNNKRKSIPTHENASEKGPIPVDDATKRSTTAASPRSKRQLDGMYSPYPNMQQPQYPYAQEMNNNAEAFFNRAPKHHRRTTVNVDVVGKRDVSAEDTPVVPKSQTHFLA